MKMHQACCAQMAEGSLDGNRYRLSEIEEGPKQTGPCGIMTLRRGQCQAEMHMAYGAPSIRCRFELEYDVTFQEGLIGLCATHFRQHVEGDSLWVQLPPS